MRTESSLSEGVLLLNFLFESTSAFRLLENFSSVYLGL
jgi:hypothetical protein